jgi:hypothetical protein
MSGTPSSFWMRDHTARTALVTVASRVSMPLIVLGLPRSCRICRAWRKACSPGGMDNGTLNQVRRSDDRRNVAFPYFAVISWMATVVGTVASGRRRDPGTWSLTGCAPRLSNCI